MIKLIVLFALFLSVFCTQEGHLIIRLKSQEDKFKLAVLKLKSTDIASFEPIVPASKSGPTGLERSEAYERLSRYYEVVPSQEFSTKLASGKSTLEQLQKEILESHGSFIDACYISPLSQLPVIKIIKTSKTTQTPLFKNRQVYLENSPRGVGQSHVVNRRGGDGTGMKVVDIEGGWDLDHEDFREQTPKLLFGVQSSVSGWADHGSAVFGEIAGNDNNFGVTGIAPKTFLFGASIYVTPTQQGVASRAMTAAAQFLSPGDIMLIELQRTGPTGKFMPMEWWPDNFDALKAATDKGVIVIEAAGNGNQDLDDPRLNNPQSGFPRDWKNPLNRSLADCGAVLVGAGAPPPGTNGVDWGPNHSRLDFSNYGASVDVQGYGREVCTTGYGDLQRGTRQTFYTLKFSGTSSASPIVVGTIAALQGVAKTEFRRTLTPAEVRKLVRTTGVPQTNHPLRPNTQRIGRFPNLKELLEQLPRIVEIN